MDRNRDNRVAATWAEPSAEGLKRLSVMVRAAVDDEAARVEARLREVRSVVGKAHYRNTRT